MRPVVNLTLPRLFSGIVSNFTSPTLPAISFGSVTLIFPLIGEPIELFLILMLKSHRVTLPADGEAITLASIASFISMGNSYTNACFSPS